MDNAPFTVMLSPDARKYLDSLEDKAEYQLSSALPENLKGSLPSIEELEVELEGARGK